MDSADFDPVLLEWESMLGANLRHTENSQTSWYKNTHYLVMSLLGLIRSHPHKGRKPDPRL